MKHFSKSFLLIALFFILLTSAIFFKIFIKGYLPIPADLLVSFYFPYYAGGWDGFNPWTTHKELLNADAVRQIFLWKDLAMEQFKIGNFPLWNPYSFAGTPLLANFQSGVFYPLNIIYFFLNNVYSWIFLVVSQVFLAGVFTYICARSFNISKIGAIFSSLAFIFSSYFISWLENVNVVHTYLWLPASIFAINSFVATKKRIYLIILSSVLTFSILAGHPQTAIYIIITNILFLLYLATERKNLRFLLSVLPFYIVPFLITALQLLPTLDLYLKSPVAQEFSKNIFSESILPFKNLITFFASDYFGNPASGNYRSIFYGDFTPYIGVIPLVFSLWAIFSLRKLKLIKFLSVSAVFFIISATTGPVTYLIKELSIPVLSSTTPARFISVSIFFLALLAGFGLDNLRNSFQKKTFQKPFSTFLLFIGFIYILLWLSAFFPQITKLNPEASYVVKRNLIIPSGLFLSIFVTSSLAFLIIRKFEAKKISVLLGAFFLTLTVSSGLYYSNKYLPFAPKQYIYPNHPVFTYLKENAQINRFYGQGTSHVDYNLSIYFRVFGVEGYDSLRLKPYAEFVESSKTGKIPDSYNRSTGAFGTVPTVARNKAFDILGLKYYLQKVDSEDLKTWNNHEFSNDNVNNLWSYQRFRIYERPTALPRVFLTTQYNVETQVDKIPELLFREEFNTSSIVLERDPVLKVEKKEAITVPKKMEYGPNQITIETDLAYDALLFLSDSYDGSWKVRLDGNEGRILKANYAFRAVEVPRGNHIVKFQYKPVAFTIGLYISLLSLAAFLLSALIIKIKNK